MGVAPELRRRIVARLLAGRDPVDIAVKLHCGYRDVVAVQAAIDMVELAADVAAEGGRPVLDARDAAEAEELKGLTAAAASLAGVKRPAIEGPGAVRWAPPRRLRKAGRVGGEAGPAKGAPAEGTPAGGTPAEEPDGYQVSPAVRADRPASEAVGGFPVAAAPCNAEETGGPGEADTNAAVERRTAGSGPRADRGTRGVTAGRDRQPASPRTVPETASAAASVAASAGASAAAVTGAFTGWLAGGGLSPGLGAAAAAGTFPASCRAPAGRLPRGALPEDALRRNTVPLSQVRGQAPRGPAPAPAKPQRPQFADLYQGRRYDLDGLTPAQACRLRSLKS